MTESISKTNNQANGTSNGDLDTGLSVLSMTGHYLHIENQATGKTRSCNVKDVVLKPPVEFWNIDTQFGRAERYINHPTNLPTITLNY